MADKNSNNYKVGYADGVRDMSRGIENLDVMKILDGIDELVDYSLGMATRHLSAEIKGTFYNGALKAQHHRKQLEKMEKMAGIFKKAFRQKILGIKDHGPISMGAG